MSRGRILLGLILVSGVVAIGSAQPPPTDGLAERAKAWIELLQGGDEDDQALAASKLLTLGPAARPALEAAAARTRDAERRAKIKAVLSLLPKAPRDPVAVPPMDNPAKEEVEVHAVGVHASNSSYFYLMMPHSRGVDWVGFCDLLVSHGEKDEPRFAKRVWDLLSPSARLVAKDTEFMQAADDVTHDRRREKPNEKVMERLTILSRDLEAVLSRPDLHQPGDRVPKGLDADSKALLESRRELSLLEKRYLNRRLFEASFPGFVKPVDFTFARNTVQVKVGRTKRPVVLVLTSYNSVRWQVQASADARIARVIVGGNHVQDVVGVSAPVEYYVADGPTRRTTEPRSFYGYPQDESEYGNARAAVKKLTGQELASLQGCYDIDGHEPFVIGEFK